MKKLPTYNEIKQQFPLSNASRQFILDSRTITQSILSGTDPRKLLIIGPCSIHNLQEAKEFAQHLKRLADEVKNEFFIIMRAFCEKSRSACGWKGLLYDPYLNDSHMMQTGIEWTRQLFIELTELQVPIATELLDPLTAFYFDDLITWGSIGARTSSSQPHRQFASGLAFPIGFKNGIAGNISAAVQGAYSAAKSHTHMAVSADGLPQLVQTKGNPDCHVILRGGESGPNFELPFINETLKLLKEHELPLRLIIDCSHQNSRKNHENQIDVFQKVIHQINEQQLPILGLMLESYLEAGKQPLLNDPSKLLYGISVTDACLDWKSTEALILEAANLSLSVK